MTALVPTALSMKLKFPEFASVADGTVEFAIEEARLSVDDTWLPTHVTVATMYLAAHHLMVGISRQQSGTGQRIKSETMDGMSITYDTDIVEVDPEDYTTTSYGLRFKGLLEISHPGVLLV
jgi:glycine/serine hydroxymethyltransferase